MIVTVACGGFFLLLSSMLAVGANRRFRSAAQLPMQWGLGGEVNWSAPRLVALAFIPALGFVTMALCIAGVLANEPRAKDEAPVSTILMAGVLLVAIQLLHLWMINRWIKRGHQ